MAKAVVKDVIFLLRKRFLSTSTGLSSLPKPSSSFTFDFLKSCGLPSESALSISGKLQIDKDKQYRPQSVFNFLKYHCFSDTQIVEIVGKYPRVLFCKVENNLKPKVEFLIQSGFEAVLTNHGKILGAVNDLRKLGIEPNKPVFVYALSVILQMTGSTWKTKLEMMKSMGWSEEDILSTFKSYPACLATSETKFRRAMDFYVNTMGLEPKSIIRYPKFLTFSIDKRLVPRYNVLKLLESKKLLSGRKNIKWQLTLTEHEFLKKFVIKFQDEIPGILDMYRAGVVGVTGSKA
ncbi:hypothetical protein K2173_009704 [Erythroxylum novogranatense]|uniref:Mitochondrial transcription termination factor n=1 Tax=Erythroxylum novogranatense TaxID=1862640 RepID=A0AAV8U8W3_9ROSI|nr:hypothetical protein K2173_009704 [Erythroxylum novogranatense]